MAKTLTFPLVGSHFRPPAKQVLTCLPSGFPLRFAAEPENPYDEKAVRVLAPMDQFPLALAGRLAAALEGTGSTVDDVLSAGADPLFLGYIGASGGKPCREMGLPGNAEAHDAAAETGPEPDWSLFRGTLGFAPDGKPTVSCGFEVAIPWPMALG